MRMKIDIDKYRVQPGKKLDLKSWPTRIEPLCAEKSVYKKEHKAQSKALKDLQEVFYAANRYALLMIFQGMDASGKDSGIEHVMSGVNPQGCEVTSFKHPSAQELSHDFLWRVAQHLPERGRIGIFNRSHYEEVLIVRVHPKILEAQAVPDGDPKKVWEGRFRSIVNFEDHLTRNGTVILKFFLHLSKDEQRERFLKRIDRPDKTWKFNAGDLEERKFWDDYQHAYEDALPATSRDRAPWYVIPADRKRDARLIIAETLIQTMQGLKLSYPHLPPARVKEMKKLRKQLEK
jgi:PPK2 family polyphosphate:nucleotide phosphotransferase